MHVVLLRLTSPLITSYQIMPCENVTSEHMPSEASASTECPWYTLVGPYRQLQRNNMPPPFAIGYRGRIAAD
jgi:hypothetical protein